MCIRDRCIEQIVEQTGPTLTIRSRRSGDRILRRGSHCHTTMKNFFQLHGVPAHARQSWPLLCSESEIVAVPGLAANGRFAVRGQNSSTGNSVSVRLDMAWPAAARKPSLADAAQDMLD